jgi:hypothetical protein
MKIDPINALIRVETICSIIFFPFEKRPDSHKTSYASDNCVIHICKLRSSLNIMIIFENINETSLFYRRLVYFIDETKKTMIPD